MILPPILYISLWTWLERLGGIGLILLGFADNSPIPLPGSMDALVVILAAHQREWWWYYALMAIVGSLAGGYAAYVVGKKSGKEAVEKKLPKEKAERIYDKFEKHGFWALFVPALLPPPVPFSPFLIAAGALQYPRTKFFLSVGFARAIRYVALAYLGSIYSKQIFGFFSHYYKPLLWTLIGLAVLGGIAALLWTRKRKREGKPVIPDVKESKPEEKVA
jgi:membrane protein YqaA with SNARE-associated domain